MYCGLIDTKIRASDKDLPVQKIWKTLAMQPTICPFNTRGNFSVPSYNLHMYVDVKSIFVEVST